MSQPISINVVRNWWLKFLMKVHRRWGLISSNRETVKRYFHFDGLGNTIALTDSSGDVQDTYAYTAFGLPLSSSGSSVNPYRYVGQWGYYDDGVMGSLHDFVLCGVRYYAPRYGRFLTWDPIGERGYGYCGNSATMAIDPTGRSAETECESRKKSCETGAQGFLTSCLAAVAMTTAACTRLCSGSGPALLGCLAGCAALGVIGAGGCYLSFKRRMSDCESEYEECLRQARQGPPAPPGPPDRNSVCYAKCMLVCVGQGKPPQRCSAYCNKVCGPQGVYVLGAV